MNEDKREDLRPFMKKRGPSRDDFFLFGILFCALVFIVVVGGILTAGWWAPCSWYGGVSIKDVPLRCIDVKR